MYTRVTRLLGIAAFVAAMPLFLFGQNVIRGPYLQQPSESRIVIKWRTDVATTSRVRYGSTPSDLTSVKDDLTASTEHEVTLTRLAPNTRYYYSIGSTVTTFRGGDEQHYFYTSPAAGSEQPVRVWAFGDAQEGNAAARLAVRDAYYKFAAGARTDMMLMLGDNATFNNIPTDDIYTEKVFSAYAEILRNTHVWSTFGNHEGFSAVSLFQTGVYYDAFAFPKNGESGGAPSGTEAYYSFDYANIHFICLNSHDIPRQEFGAMMTWLKNDLAQNRQKWTIAYFHHPPYSKGSHDSDNPGMFPETPESATSMREMREIAVPILENAGVDLVLNGHSHTYERSFLLDGHYGTSDTLIDSMVIDGGDGRVDGDGPYKKTPDVTADSHAGTVYTVAGSAGNARTGDLDHPVMVSSFGNINGSMVIDVSGDRLDARFIDSNVLDPKVLDHFTIIKTPAQPPTAPSQLPIDDDAFPDQFENKDRDGRYMLSWAYPPAPVEQPCGYAVEESNPSGSIFTDDANERLINGSNSKWTSGGDWVSTPYPSALTGDRQITTDSGYTVLYTANQNSPLTMIEPVFIPVGYSTKLSFNSYEDIEEGFDFGYLEASADGGPFETLETYTGTFSGKRYVDLSSYSGKHVTLRFRLTSDYITVTGELGWSIDNIDIQTSNWKRIGTTSSRSFDVTGRGNGTYAYRINGLFGDCSTGGTAGAYSNSQQITVALGSPTYAPTASFTTDPEQPETGQSIAFDASTSRDNDTSGSAPDIGTYFWTFGDGTTERTSSPVTPHAYATAGVYRVRLVVTDNEGETGETERYVVVSDPQPAEIAATGSGSIGVQGQKASFGFEARKSGAAYTGSLQYHDRANGLKVTGLSVTSVERYGNRVVFSGTCTVNKQAGYTFTIEAVDGSPDTFRIRLSNGYEASGSLNDGNIVIGP